MKTICTLCKTDLSDGSAVYLEPSRAATAPPRITYSYCQSCYDDRLDMWPLCVCCAHSATPAHRVATYVAASSGDQGQTVRWQSICSDCAMTWNEGGDWPAPLIKLGNETWEVEA